MSAGGHEPLRVMALLKPDVIKSSLISSKIKDMTTRVIKPCSQVKQQQNDCSDAELE